MKLTSNNSEQKPNKSFRYTTSQSKAIANFSPKLNI